jgi:hypothetical protein
MDASHLQGISSSDLGVRVRSFYPALLRSVLPLRATMESADLHIICDELGAFGAIQVLPITVHQLP